MRLKNFLAGIIIFLCVGTALFLQIKFRLNPCPLCILQRMAFLALGLTFFFFSFIPLNRTMLFLESFLLLIFSGSGLIFSGRQIYLQHLPPGSAEGCGPGFDYLFSNLPWQQALNLILKGSGECALVDWRFLGMSMAEYAAIILFISFLWAFYLFIKSIKGK